ITDSNGKASRKKGDTRIVLRVITTKEGLPKLRKLDQSGSEHSDHYDHRITLGVITV
ncbi:hypothetical protein M433DRAFT_160694, partial [Acidomyces richmondensis BFW]